jgi:RNA polymerase sigma-70 factor (ECF subfamily)
MDRSTSPSDWIAGYQAYLYVLARASFPSELRAKLDPADIVQQAMLQAHEALHGFRGTTDGERAAWLRQILAHTLHRAIRDVKRDKRDAGREVSLVDELDESSRRLGQLLAADQTSPSQRAIRNEELVRLADALLTLPKDQQDAVILHYFAERPVADIAIEMARSTGAVAALIYRGLETLRKKLAFQDSSHDAARNS